MKFAAFAAALSISSLSDFLFLFASFSTSSSQKFLPEAVAWVETSRVHSAELNSGDLATFVVVKRVTLGEKSMRPAYAPRAPHAARRKKRPNPDAARCANRAGISFAGLFFRTYIIPRILGLFVCTEATWACVSDLFWPLSRDACSKSDAELAKPDVGPWLFLHCFYKCVRRKSIQFTPRPS